MKKIKEFYIKYREVINYLFFGGCTTLVSWGTYALFVDTCGMDVRLGNVLSWVCAVVFAYVTNKLWVFFSRRRSFTEALREAGEFFLSRAGTGVVEILGLPLLMRLGLDQPLFGVEGLWAKIAVTIVVIILNYFLSKYIVFRKQNKNG